MSLYSIKNLGVHIQTPLRSANAIMPQPSLSPRYRIGSQVTDGADMQLLHFLPFPTKAAASCKPLPRACATSLAIRIALHVARRCC